MRCDVKIMAVPSRSHLVTQTLIKLGLSNQDVIYDTKGEKMPLKTMMKALELPVQEGITHRCIIQDDVEVGDKFWDNINFLCENYPNSVFSLFMSDSLAKLYEKYNGIICKTGGAIWGQAVIIPLSLLNYMETLYSHIQDYPHDDRFVQYCCAKKKIEVLTTVPCIVDHLCRQKYNSAMGHRFGMTEHYRYDRDADVRQFVFRNDLTMWKDRDKGIDYILKDII